MPSLPERAYWTAFTAWHTRGQSSVPYRPLASLKAIQERRVRSIVAHAWRTVPFYREAMARLGLRPSDFRSAADLERLPLVGADEFASDPERFYARGFRRDRVVENLTSGTGGHRKLVLYDLRSVFLSLAEGQRRRNVVARLTGIARRARTLEFRVPICSSTLVLEAQRRYSLAPPWMVAQRLVHAPTAEMASAVAALNTRSPDVIIGYGSFIGGLFRHAAATGQVVHRPRLIIAHSDNMPEADRELIEESFGVPVVSNYVAAESGFIAFQCEERRGFHIDIDRVAVRIIDEEGLPVAPGGRGDVVVSNLTNRATVLLNYRLGDVVTVGRGACPCGRTLPTIERIDGRTNAILLPDGSSRRVMPFLIELQRSPELVQVQLRHERPLGFVVRAVVKPEADREAIRSLAERLLRETVRADIEVRVEFPTAIVTEPGDKVRALVRCFD